MNADLHTFIYLYFSIFQIEALDLDLSDLRQQKVLKLKTTCFAEAAFFFFFLKYLLILYSIILIHFVSS